MSSLDTVMDAIKAFNQILNENKRFGCYDSEVLRKKNRILEAALALETYIRIPKTSDDWELYNIPGSQQVADKLNTAMTAIVDAISNMTVNDFKVLKGKSHTVMY